MMKKAPMKVMKMMLDSVVGQKRIEIGTQASGGIGRMISMTGYTRWLNVWRVPNNSPSGIPSSCAIRKPYSTRLKLATQEAQ